MDHWLWSNSIRALLENRHIPQILTLRLGGSPSPASATTQAPSQIPCGPAAVCVSRYRPPVCCRRHPPVGGWWRTVSNRTTTVADVRKTINPSVSNRRPIPRRPWPNFTEIRVGMVCIEPDDHARECCRAPRFPFPLHGLVTPDSLTDPKSHQTKFIDILNVLFFQHSAYLGGLRTSFRSVLAALVFADKRSQYPL